jgi:hypothetical protein
MVVLQLELGHGTITGQSLPLLARGRVRLTAQYLSTGYIYKGCQIHTTMLAAMMPWMSFDVL